MSLPLFVLNFSTSAVQKIDTKKYPDSAPSTKVKLHRSTGTKFSRVSVKGVNTQKGRNKIREAPSKNMDFNS